MADKKEPYSGYFAGQHIFSSIEYTAYNPRIEKVSVGNAVIQSESEMDKAALATVWTKDGKHEFFQGRTIEEALKKADDWIDENYPFGPPKKPQ